MKHQQNLVRIFSLLLILAFLFAPVAQAQPVQAATPADLFFSEYIEGSSNNKALEIYNGTGAAVDLAAGGYQVQMFFNGSSSAGLTLALTGTVAAGDVYVLAQSSADPAILAQADLTNGGGWFNGDDAVVLSNAGGVLDVIGQIGVDPGSEWGSGLTSTADNTLRRKVDICAGDPDGSDAFDPAVEWDGFPQNTFDGLGAHIASCGDTPPPTTAEPKINEFSASTTGTDVEYVEIFGEPETDYSAYAVLEIEGDYSSTTPQYGTVDEVISLETTDANGFYLANLPANSLENGTLSLLLVKNFTGALNDDLDTNDDGTFDVTPWEAVVDSVAVNDGGAGDLTYGTPVLGVSYDGLSFAPGGASRYPDGMDTDAATDWVRNDFDLAGIPGFTGTLSAGEALNTPGAANEIYVAPPEACGDPFTPIYEVQGNGAASPLVGAEVAVEGVVVGDFQNGASPNHGNLGGFFVEDPTGDGDPATSDGVFIFGGSLDVAVGDAVRVRGPVSEYKEKTEISASSIWTCSSGNSVAPVELSLPVSDTNDFEAYEGMLVTFPQALIISEYFDYDRYGEIVLTSQRHLTPTAEFEPGSPEEQQAVQDFLLDSITLDDGISTQNPSFTLHPDGLEFSMTNRFRGGDTLTNVTGVMDNGFGIYLIEPTKGADYENTNPRTAAPDQVGGNTKVASANVLNYFTTIDDGSNNCGPVGYEQNCRGADTQVELDRQRAKIVAELNAINADVVGLMEIQNDGNDELAEDLVAGLNDLMGAGTYDVIHTGFIGTDAIKLAIIYKPAAVTPLGDFALLTSEVDPRFIDTSNRPALAQTFQNNQTGGIFTVAVNHLKSKGSACAGDPDLLDGAGNCNLTRTAAAKALVDWLATDPTGSGDADYLIIGDLNSYDKEDPIDAILAGPDDVLGTADDYTDTIFKFQGENAYSYVFDGQTGYLDQALSSATLTPQVTGVTVWHNNADEPDLIDYDMEFKSNEQDAFYAPDAYRASDHDPVVIGINVFKYDYNGFFPPINALPDVNKAKAGSVIPVKFSLNGDQGLGILANGYPVSFQVDPDTLAPLSDPELTQLPGKRGLTYDPLAGQYIYGWQTSKSWAGTYRLLKVVLADGSIHYALFTFK